MEATAIKRTVLRGVATREALLDAAEMLIADLGFHAPSHRMIATQAKAHVALVNYHFSSKEILFEAAIERRATRLTDAWGAALDSVRARPACRVEQILEAWWRPFDTINLESERPWSNYLCVVARLTSAADGEAWHQRYFGKIDRGFHAALAAALPCANRDDVEAGFRYSRSLFGEVLLHRCGKTGGTCRPRGFREEDIGRLIRYLGSGMRGLAGRLSLAAG
jgi:AcrR family transcriptional regulator